jgi:predicted N-acetyltransferase YhbS
LSALLAPDGLDLGAGLTLRPVRDEADIQKYIAINERVTGEGAIAERLLRRHPRTTLDDYVLVEDARTGEAVSTTCLIPWRVRCGSLVLDVAMLEMVVTHADYRRRGLVRAQIEVFHQRAAARGFDACIIQGIPYYYRQYGYAYALDHTPRVKLATAAIPAGAVEGEYRFRRATPADVETLTALYAEAHAAYAIAVERTPADWRYLLAERILGEVTLMERRADGAPAGYWAAHRITGAGEQAIAESAAGDPAAALAALRQLKAGGAERLELFGGPAHGLVGPARALGAEVNPPYQWLWRFPDLRALLVRMRPLFEERLARADLGDLTAEVVINLYRQAYGMRFAGGRLLGVEPLGFVDASLGADGGDLCLPPEAFTRLLWGYRSLDELRDAWPDAYARRGSRRVIEALFPRCGAHVAMPY